MGNQMAAEALGAYHCHSNIFRKRVRKVTWRSVGFLKCGVEKSESAVK